MTRQSADIRRADGPLSITERELFERLAWFTHVRWVFGGLGLIALLVSWYVVGLRLRTADGELTMAPAVETLLLVLLYNAVFTFLGRVLRARQRITRRMIEVLALAQILCDLVAITILIHATGGVENVFIILLLVPIAIVTELLHQRLAYATAAIAAVCFNVVAWGEQQGLISHVAVEVAGRQPRDPATGAYLQPLHVLHVTAAVTVTLFALVFVASTIASRLRAREAELEEAYHKLRLADEAKGFFMRKAEHEMRAPLSAIHSILDAMAQAPGDLGAEQRHLIDRAKHRARCMMELVNDLLKFSRLGAPEEILKMERVCLSDVVCNTAELMRKQAEAAGLTLGWRAPRVFGDGDAEMLRELATNLIANAIQYTPAGGRVDVELIRRGEQAVLTVADTGIGISDDARARLFDEFYRAPEAKQQFPNGTGLGLAIVRRIVRIHRGDIDVQPRSEGGTTFRVTLPLRRPAGSP